MSWCPSNDRDMKEFFNRKRFRDVGQILDSALLIDQYKLWLLARPEMLPRRIINRLKKRFSGYHTTPWDQTQSWEKTGRTRLYMYIYVYTPYPSKIIVDYIRGLYEENPW